MQNEQLKKFDIITKSNSNYKMIQPASTFINELISAQKGFNLGHPNIFLMLVQKRVICCYQ